MNRRWIAITFLTLAILSWNPSAWADSESESEPSADEPKTKRVAVAVFDFDFGTVSNHWWGDYDIGKGIADLIVDEMVNDGTFRVIERKKLESVLSEQDFAASDRADPSAKTLAQIGKVLGVRYLVVGSITRFGSEDKTYGGGGIGGGVIGGLGVKRAKTEVGITTRLIDTTTGEIMVSVKALGVSKKGGGLVVGGGAGGGGGGFGMGTSDFRESAIGEATEKAVEEIVEKVVEKKDRLS